MNLVPDLEQRIERARAWLAKMTEGGGIRRNLDLTTGELGPVSSEITGYAAHLHAWLFAVNQRDDDRRRARMYAEWLAQQWDLASALTVEPEKPWVYFFDLGIAARGLYAVAKSTQRQEFWDLAIVLASQMSRFRREDGLYDPILHCDFIRSRDGTPAPARDWWSTLPGPYQRKAALIWKIVKRFSDYDDLDLRFYSWSPADEPKKRASDEQLAIAADLLHPLAYSCEALLIGEASQERARRQINVLQSRIYGRSEHLRCDALAQYLRLHLLQGQPLPLAQLDRMLDMQHESGGFHFKTAKSKPGQHLSTHATIFAIQVMAMAQAAERTKFPGPLGRRELAIV